MPPLKDPSGNPTDDIPWPLVNTPAAARFNWLTKLNFIDCMEDFRGGAFKGMITWQTSLLDDLMLLIQSDLLTGKEQLIVAEKGAAIEDIVRDLLAGTSLSFDEIIHRTKDVDRAFFDMVAKDTAPRRTDPTAMIFERIALNSGWNEHDPSYRNKDGTVTIRVEGKKIMCASFAVAMEAANKKSKLEHEEMRRHEENEQDTSDGADGAKNKRAESAKEAAKGPSTSEDSQQKSSDTKTGPKQVKPRKPTGASGNEDSDLSAAFKKNLRGAFL